LNSTFLVSAVSLAPDTAEEAILTVPGTVEGLVDWAQPLVAK
jgi:hypothetical protein